MFMKRTKFIRLTTGVLTRLKINLNDVSMSFNKIGKHTKCIQNKNDMIRIHDNEVNKYMNTIDYMIKSILFNTLKI